MRKAPIVASSWLSWMSMLMTWTGVLSAGSRLSNTANTDTADVAGSRQGHQRDLTSHTDTYTGDVQAADRDTKSI